MKAASLANALFSNVQQKVLALIFGRPERSFYMSEIVRNVRSGNGAVERELLRLQESGLVSVERVGNQKHYRANRESPIFSELRNIVLKTSGLSEPLKQSLAPHASKIGAAFVYGSIAKGTDTASSEIDLMVIGNDLTYSDLYGGLQKAEDFLQRRVDATFLTIDEWNKESERKYDLCLQDKFPT
jgi:predicted nucleotidyltransferase/predicted transcriptional regulator with HTH domain